MLLTLLTIGYSVGQTQIINISNGEVFDGEPFMVVNDNNSSHIVIAWMGFDGFNLIAIRTSVSFNGGASWTEPVSIPHTVPLYTSADPSMAYDSDGNLFLCYIDYIPTGTSGQTLVRKSTDGGLTWGEPVTVIDALADGIETPVDRPWMVIDKSGSASDGNIYVTTKPAPWIPFPNRNYFMASTDHGATFGDWRYIDTIGWRIGPFIAAPMATPTVGLDGTFYCIYPAWEVTENFLPRFILAQSNSAGETFSYSEVFESFGDDLNSDTSAKAGYLLTTSPVDENHLVFTYILSTYGDLDIFYRESINKGVSWSAPIRVNDDAIGNNAMQELVWSDFDADGDLVIAWRDRRYAVDTGFAVASEIYAAVKWKDDATFSPNFNLSGAAVPFDSVLFGNGNDFMNVAMANDTLYATWGDTRDGFLNIWFTKRAANGTGTAITTLLSSENYPALSVYPNPTLDLLQIEQTGFTHYRITDQSGKTCLEGNLSPDEAASITVKQLPAGTYTISTIGKTGSRTAQFIKL